MVNEFPNRPMKLWEVISGFRSQKEVLHAVFELPQWKEPYLRYLVGFNDLVSPRQPVVDEFVPLELTREICRRCTRSYAVRGLPEYAQIIECDPHRTDLVGLPLLTALEVHDLYGPAIIEEVQEFGSAIGSKQGPEGVPPPPTH